MIKLLFYDKELTIPSHPDEISLDKGMNIMYVWLNQEHNYETKIEILNILKPLSIWQNISKDTIDDIFNQLDIINIEKAGNLIYYPIFKINNTIYGLHNMYDVTVREYMDLEFYLTYNESIYENIDKIAAILYRPLKTKTNKLKNILYNKVNNLRFKNIVPIVLDNFEIEDYSDHKHLKNGDIFREKLTYSMGLSALNIYIEFKNKLYDEFKPIFQGMNDEEDPFAEQEAAYLEEHKDEIEKSFEEVWGFYHVFMQLVPTLTERELWLNKDIKEILKYLTYSNSFTIYQNNKMKNNG